MAEWLGVTPETKTAVAYAGVPSPPGGGPGSDVAGNGAGSWFDFDAIGDRVEGWFSSAIGGETPEPTLLYAAGAAAAVGLFLLVSDSG
ncbi:MAG: hypothetical protein IPK75_20485 [Acidobacteria bacterium]|nr:hypothetical protein [Acidobacteriota bacterium]